MSFFSIHFSPPTQSPLFWGPRTQVHVPHSWERTQKRDPHKLSRGDFGVNKGPQTGHFGPQKVLFTILPYLKHANRPLCECSGVCCRSGASLLQVRLLLPVL